MKSLILAILTAMLWTSIAWAEPTPTEARTILDMASNVCPLMIQEAALIQQIELEKQNPSGVIDLRRLHALGSLLTFTRAQLREAREYNAHGLRVFRRVYRHDLNLPFCEVWQAHE